MLMITIRTTGRSKSKNRKKQMKTKKRKRIGPKPMTSGQTTVAPSTDQAMAESLSDTFSQSEQENSQSEPEPRSEPEPELACPSAANFDDDPETIPDSRSKRRNKICRTYLTPIWCLKTFKLGSVGLLTDQTQAFMLFCAAVYE